MVYLLHLQDRFLQKDFQGAVTVLFDVQCLVDFSEITCANEVKDFEVGDLSFFELNRLDGGLDVCERVLMRSFVHFFNLQFLVLNELICLDIKVFENITYSIL